MGTFFYINEILDFAVEREQESYDLYQELAGKVGQQALKDIFHTLAGEEQQHKKTYSALLSTLEQKHTPSAQGYDEYDEYMRTLIDARRTIKQPPVDLSNIQEVLDFAIEREKDAVLFYVGLENYVPQKDQSTVRSIIKEEGSHIVKLSKMKKEVNR